MSKGLADLRATFLEAVEEVGVEDPTEFGETLSVDPTEPAPQEEPVATGQVEQPAEVEATAEPIDEELQSLLNDSVEESGVEGSEDPVAEFLTSDAFAATQVEIETVDGTATVSIKELTDGYMRQRDYTQKTQNVAAEKEAVQEAITFHEAFRVDPVAFARAAAVRAGLIDEGDEPVKEIEFSLMPTPDEYEAEIQSRVEKAFEADPRTQELVIAQAQQHADTLFAGIEKEHNVVLDAALRTSIVDEAARRGTGDLELVFEARISRVQAKRVQTSKLKAAAPSRPSRPAAGGEAEGEPEEVIETAKDAFEAALAEQAQ